MSRVFETFTEVVGWIQIVCSFLFIGIIMGWLVYMNYPGNFGTFSAWLIVLVCFIFGVFRATKAYKEKGTMHLTRV